MIWTVLVPSKSKPFFISYHPHEIRPIFYRLQGELFQHRILRKLGLRDTAKTLAYKFKILTDGKSLEEIRALWLSDDINLYTSEIEILVEKIPNLQWVYSERTGTDHLNLEFFRQRQVMVSNTGNLVTRWVAQMAFSNILSQAKHLPEHLILTRKRQWRSLFCEDITKQTVGIVGTGNIGMELANLCRSVGMRVIGVSRDPARFRYDPAPYHRILDIKNESNDLFAEADYVVITLPLNEETHGFIGKRELDIMKESATLINIGRAHVIDEEAVFKALNDGSIAAAYLEMLSQKPLFFWQRAYRTPNLYITHNSAAHLRKKLEKTFKQFVLGVHESISTGKVRNRVV
jgi:phosphoglycerate dehydrogenase-like enzyme